MSRCERRAFRPSAERIEDRFLTTGGLNGVIAHHPFVLKGAQPAAPGLIAEAAVHKRGQMPPAHRPGIGPGLGDGLVRITLPWTYQDNGVVTIWNNTNDKTFFSVGANTYNNGTLYPFVLNPGQFRSFYAPKVGSNLPVFAVSFGNGSPLIPLPQQNLVYEVKGYVPSGTAGWPYAINLGVNGYYLSYI